MSIHLQNRRTVDLGGHVIWATRAAQTGAPPGMGICLASPPKPYLVYVRALS